MQVPSNMLITKVRPGIYMSAWMLVWAAVSGEHMPCQAIILASLLTLANQVVPHWSRIMPASWYAGSFLALLKHL